MYIYIFKKIAGSTFSYEVFFFAIGLADTRKWLFNTGTDGQTNSLEGRRSENGYKIKTLFKTKNAKNVPQQF